jgi:tetratricopeptide (TPR) repeat protein
MLELLASDHLIHDVLDSPVSPALQEEIDALVRGVGECGVPLRRVHWGGAVLFLATGKCADAYFTVGLGSDGPELRLVELTPPGATPNRNRIALLAGGSAEGSWTTQVVTPSDPLEVIHACTEPETLPSHAPWRRIRTHWKQPEDLALRLTPIQHSLLYAHRPLLIQGVAGAGKTTILAHMAQRRLAETPAASVLLVTYTPQLRQYLTSLLAGLFDGRLPDRLRIVDWRSLCDDIAMSLNLQSFKWFGQADGAFSNAWSPSNRHASLTKRLGEELRSTLKGSHCDLTRTMLSEEEYFIATERSRENKRIFAEALKYQAHLTSQGQVDEMDAARQLLQHGELLPTFDHVLVDEAQDLTMIQLWLVARLAATPEGLVFAGDDCQVVHPSRFSWNRVRDALHHVGVERPPQPRNLDTNHRCPRRVMELALRVAWKRARRLGNPAPSVPTSDRPALPIPVRLAITEPELDNVLKELAAIVASLGVIQTPRGWKTAERWSFQGVGFRRSFTPQSVKGIEFDVTVLLRFGRDYKHLTTGQQGRLSDEEYAFAASEVYVSITRTRGLLVALDVQSTEPQFWQDSELSEWFEQLESPDALLERVHRGHAVDGPKGWQRAAIDFEHQNAYEAAAECWQRGAAPEKAGRAFDLAGRLDLAAPLYRDLGLIEDAAHAFHRNGQSAEAAALWEGLGRWESAARAWDQSAPTRANRRRAAIAWRRAGHPELAAPHFEAANHWGEAASCWQEVGTNKSLRLAAVAWGREGYACFGRDADSAKPFVHAVDCWGSYFARLALPIPTTTAIRPSPAEFTLWLLTVLDTDPNTTDGDYIGMAEKLEDLQMWSEAGAMWRRARRPLQAARAYVNCLDLESARSMLREGHKDGGRDVAFCREEAAFWTDSAKRLEVGEYYELSAIAASEAAELEPQSLARWNDVGARWKKAGNFKRAGEAFRRASQWPLAAQMFEEAGDLESAVAAWRRASPTRTNKNRLRSAVNRARKLQENSDH